MGRLFFNGVFAIQMVWLAWGISWFAASGWSAGVARLAPEQWRYRIFTFSSFPLLLVFSPVFQRPPFLLYNAPRLLQWAMFACVCGIVAFSWWSRLTLGRLWSASIQRKDAHRVVEEGPYALVRHPIYTALIGAGLATATAKGTVIAWAGRPVLSSAIG